MMKYTFSKSLNPEPECPAAAFTNKLKDDIINASQSLKKTEPKNRNELTLPIIKKEDRSITSDSSRPPLPIKTYETTFAKRDNNSSSTGLVQLYDNFNKKDEKIQKNVHFSQDVDRFELEKEISTKNEEIQKLLSRLNDYQDLLLLYQEKISKCQETIGNALIDLKQ